jgi:Glycosyltransferase family 87
VPHSRRMIVRFPSATRVPVHWELARIVSAFCGILLVVAMGRVAARVALGALEPAGVDTGGWIDSPGFVFVALHAPIPSITFHVALSWLVIAPVVATVIAVGFLSRLAAASLARLTKRPIAALTSTIVVAGVALASMPVLLNPDPYAYIIYGHLVATYHVDPYIAMNAVDTSRDLRLVPALRLWANPPPRDNYGPLWTDLSAAVAFVAGGFPLAQQIVVQRLIALAGVVVTALGLIALDRDPDHSLRVRRAGMFAFHPLVLLETVFNAHNDILMVAAAVLAFAARRALPSGLAIGASIAIKYVSVIAIPFLAVREMRRSRRPALLLGAATVLVVAAFLPFWRGWGTLSSVMSHSGHVALSPAALLAALASGFDPDRLAFPWVTLQFVRHLTIARVADLALVAAFAAIWITAVARYSRRPSRGPIAVTALAFLYATPAIGPYLLVWISPLFAFDDRYGRFARTLGTCALGYYLLTAIPKFTPIEAAVYIAFVFGAPIVGMAIVTLRRPALEAS